MNAWVLLTPGIETMKRLKTLSLATLLAGALAIPVAASAEPVQVPVQGLLTDSDGLPIDGDTSITFAIYPAADDAAPLWTSSREVPVDAGMFTVMLGAQADLDSDLFHANPGASITLQIQGDLESARIPLGHLPLAAHAASASSADDAQTLQGLTPDDLRSVSAADVSFDDEGGSLEAADTQAALTRILARVEDLERDRDALSTRVTTLEADNASLGARVTTLETGAAAAATRLAAVEAASSEQAASLTDLTGDVSSLTSTVSSFSSRITAAEAAVSAIDARVDAVDALASTNEGGLSTVQASLAGVQAQVTSFAADVQSNSSDVAAVTSTQGAQATRLTALETKTSSMSATTIGGRAAVVFDAVNLHVRSGVGTTAGIVNGLGNLIVGYDEARASSSDKSGSHNLILGRQNNYTSFGGLVGGFNNAITGSYASIITGNSNEATATYSVVVTGSSNDATGTSAVVVTGSTNEATNGDAVVISGSSNDATGLDSVVVSGSTNRATDNTSVAVGGYDNESSGWRSVTVGGSSNVAGGATGGSYITVSGGLNRTETTGNYWRGGTQRSQ